MRRELDVVRHQMERALVAREQRSIWIAGPAGSGKTWMLRATVAEAREAGWFAVAVSCAAASQANPQALMLDLFSAVVRELGVEAPSYASGLNRALAILRPGSSPQLTGGGADGIPHEIAVSRLLEGIAADRPVAIAIDDAHAMGGESARALRYVLGYLSGVPLCVVCARRDDVPAHRELPSHGVAIALGPLGDDESRRIASSEYPEAPGEVLDAIVERAHGVPAEIVLLASQARADGARCARDISASLQAKVAADLAQLDEVTRTFLSYCALLDGAIEERVLAVLYPQPDVLAKLVGHARAYLVARGGRLSFRHELLAQAIRASMQLELPLRRDVLAALVAGDGGSMDDYDRIVAHAKALGDRETGHDYSLRLADAAFEARLWDRAVAAFESALAFRWPERARFMSFFRSYATALRAAHRDAEAEAVVVRALRYAREMHLAEGTGRLAGTLVGLQTQLEEFDRAIATYERAIAEITDETEVSELRGGISMTFANMVNAEGLARVAAEMRAARTNTPLAMASLHQSEAMLEARLGRPDAARSALRLARSFAAQQQSGLDFSLPLIELLTAFEDHGCRVFDDLENGPQGVSRGEELAGYWHYYHATADLARGRWNAVRGRLEQLNLERLPRLTRMLLLAVDTAMGAFALNFEMSASVVETVDAESRRGLGPSGFQLAVWTLAAQGAKPDLAREVARQLPALRARPLAIDLICFVPVALSLYAVHDDHELAVQLADAEIPACSRWMRAQHLFGRGYCSTALGRAEGAALLHEAAEGFEMLGATFFTSLAAASAKPGAIKLQRANGRVRPVGKRKRTDGLTARELQIGQLVAQGMRNREIARDLFLSERTVEAHLTNVFAKLSLRSRTQLTRYMSE